MGNGGAKVKGKKVDSSTTQTTNSHATSAVSNHSDESQTSTNTTKATTTSPEKKKGESKPKRQASLKEDGPLKKIEKFFEDYKDPSEEGEEDKIGFDGTVKLLEDVNVDPEDPTVLVFAWHFQAKESGCFSKSEWIAGCKKLGVENIDQLKAKWASFKSELENPKTFKDIYKFTFTYVKEEPQHKTLTLEVAKSYLNLLLAGKPHVSTFCEFLDQQSEYRAINADQWMVLLDFIQSVKEDLSNYDENAAWPVILDSFVEWKKKKLAAQ